MAMMLVYRHGLHFFTSNDQGLSWVRALNRMEVDDNDTLNGPSQL